MQQALGMAGPLHFVAHECKPLQPDRLGLAARLNREPLHHSRCRLRWRQNREQISSNGHAGKSLRRGLFRRERRRNQERTNAHWIELGRVEVRHGSVSQLPPILNDGREAVNSILQTSGKYAGTSRRVSFSSDKSPAVRKLVILSAFEGCAKNRNRSKGQPMRSLRSFASLRMTGSFLPGYISFLRPVRNRNWVYRLISHAPSL